VQNKASTLINDIFSPHYNIFKEYYLIK